MSKLTYYDIFGVMAPGAVLLAGLLLALGDLNATSLVKEVSIGGLGIFALVAYPAGQVVQAGGNLLEKLYWKARGGMPTDWVRTGRYQKLPLADAQFDELERTYARKLGLATSNSLSELSRGDWGGITRQVRAAVDVAGRTERVAVFNSTYGFHRGLCVALLIVAVVVVASGAGWWLSGLAVLGAGVALYRMHRFGKHYARELFVEFIELPRAEAQLRGSKDATVGNGSESSGEAEQ